MLFATHLGVWLRSCCTSTKKHSGETTEDLVKAAFSLLGDNQDSIKSYDTYLDYVKVWTTTTDHGGFEHISDDICRFF